MISNGFTALVSLITVALAFAFLYHLWQQYVIDATRHQLFELRDQVFDLATSGKLERSEPPYQVLRAMLNSSLRFTHHMSLIRITYTILVFGITHQKPLKEYAKEVDNIIKNIGDKETKYMFLDILRQMQFIIGWHMIRTSPLTLIFSFLILFLAKSVRTMQHWRVKFGDYMNGLTYSDAVS